MTLQLIAEGKTKQIYYIGGGGVRIVSKDDITAGDGARHDVMEGKARWATATTCNVFLCLERAGVPTHFIGSDDFNPTSFDALRCRMIPVEVVMRRLAFGSYLKRAPDVESGTRFDEVVVEFFDKDDAAHDPMLVVHQDSDRPRVSRHHADRPLDAPDSFIDDLDEARADELVGIVSALTSIGRDVFEVLEAAWAQLGHTLVDLKIEFGITDEGRLVVADVIDNDSWRVWLDGDPDKQVDKQVYRDLGLDDPGTAMRIKGNYALVARLTEQFPGARP